MLSGGVTLNCFGMYPESYPNYNAYAYNDTQAHSGNNVMGGRIIGDIYHWLNFSLCYGSAEFEDPVDMFRIYGAGDSFELVYYNQDGVRRGLGDSVVGHIVSSGDSFLEISAESGYLISGDVIKRVEFGSITGDHYTYFDDLTFCHTPTPNPCADFGRTDCSEDCEGDFDNDNDVDGSDLAVFAADFGRTICP